jgi:DNA primase
VLRLSLGDEHQERDIARILILSGNQFIDESKELRVGHFIIQNIQDIIEGFEHPLYRKVVELFLHRFMEGTSFPDAAFFINHDASELKNLAVSFTISPYTLSENWEKKWDIFLTQKIPEENFIKDASDSLKRFRFRKIGKLIRENLTILKTMDASENEALYLKHLKLHILLKNQQASLAKETGTVVVG